MLHWFCSKNPNKEEVEKMSNELAKTSIKEEYQIVQGVDGKFVRKAVYQPFASVVAETREQKINLMKLLDSDEIALPMGEHVGAEFKVSDVIFQPYDKVDEETGEIEHGVLTYVIDPKETAYVTSSKSVYFTLKRVFQVFGEPHYNEEEAIAVKIVKKKGQTHQYTDLQIIG
jgi:hypothetical protein